MMFWTGIPLMATVVNSLIAGSIGTCLRRRILRYLAFTSPLLDLPLICLDPTFLTLFQSIEGDFSRHRYDVTWLSHRVIINLHEGLGFLLQVL